MVTTNSDNLFSRKSKAKAKTYEKFTCIFTLKSRVELNCNGCKIFTNPA